MKNSSLLRDGYVLLKIVFYIILLLGFLQIPLTTDYGNFSTSTRSFLAGESRLYDEYTNSYYYLPWGLLITVPLSFLPDQWGQAILIFLSVGGVLLSVKLLVGKIPLWAVLIILLNLYTINLAFSGQWDGIVLGASGLAWYYAQRKKPLWLGLMLLMLTTKPTNSIVFLIMICAYLIRSWSLKEILKVAILPVLGFLFSLSLCGVDWPIRYVYFLNHTPPVEALNVSLWNNDSWTSILVIVVVFLWFLGFLYRGGINRLSLSFSFVVNLIISPYLLTYHFVGVSPSLGWLSKRGWIYSIIPWLVMAYHSIAIVRFPTERYFFLYPLSVWICFLLAFSKTDASHTELLNFKEGE